MKDNRENSDIHYKQESLDLELTDYKNNSDLQKKVKRKPATHNTDLMRFRSDINRVIWSGITGVQTKIVTVILAQVGQELAGYIQKQVNLKLNELKAKNVPISDKRITEITSQVVIPSEWQTTMSYSEVRKRINYHNSHINLGDYIDSISDKMAGFSRIKQNGVTYTFPLFKLIKNDNPNKEVTFYLNDVVLELLVITKKGDFIYYPVREIVDLSSPRSQTLLRLLKRLRTKGNITFRKHTAITNDIARIGLWEQLGIKDGTSEYRFTTMLTDALIEISPYFHNLNFTKNYKSVHGHNSVVSYTFTWTPESPDKNTSNDSHDKVVNDGLVNIDSCKCLTQDQKFKAVDKLLKQRIGTAKKEYSAIHPSSDKNGSEDKNKGIDTKIWEKTDNRLAISDFSDKELGTEALNADLTKLHKMGNELLEKVQNNKGDASIVTDYLNIRRLIQKKKRAKLAKKIKKGNKKADNR